MWMVSWVTSSMKGNFERTAFVISFCAFFHFVSVFVCHSRFLLLFASISFVFRFDFVCFSRLQAMLPAMVIVSMKVSANIWFCLQDLASLCCVYVCLCMTQKCEGLYLCLYAIFLSFVCLSISFQGFCQIYIRVDPFWWAFTWEHYPFEKCCSSSAFYSFRLCPIPLRLRRPLSWALCRIWHTKSAAKYMLSTIVLCWSRISSTMASGQMLTFGWAPADTLRAAAASRCLTRTVRSSRWKLIAMLRWPFACPIILRCVILNILAFGVVGSVSISGTSNLIRSSFLPWRLRSPPLCLFEFVAFYIVCSRPVPPPPAFQTI